MNLINYLRRVKNTRGILLFDPTKEKPYTEKIFSFLVSKHKYRDIGVPPSLYNDKLDIKPFVKLNFFKDTKEIEKICNELSSPTMPYYIIESVAYSLAFATPIYILDQALFKQLEPLTVWTLKVNNLPTESELIRNIRIAGYSMIDFYEIIDTTIDNIIKYLNNEVELSRIKVVLAKRKEYACKDGNKRFWRAKQQSLGCTTIAYFDLLRLFIEKPNLLKLFSEAEGALPLLSISCGVLVY